MKRKLMWVIGIPALVIFTWRFFQLVRFGCYIILYPLIGTALAAVISGLILWILWR